MSNEDLSGFSMMELYREEVQAHTAALSDGLLQLESDPSDTSGIEPLMRAAHSAKGAARIVGLDDIVRLAHVMEDVFVAAQESRLVLASDDVDLLLASVDLISKTADLGDAEVAGFMDANRGEIDSLVARLEATRSGTKKPAAAPKQAAAKSTTATPTSEDLSGFSMMELFRAEAETHTASLQEGLLRLEENPGRRDELEALMRAAHSVKGAARIVGLDALVALAHALEDAFVAAQENRVSLSSDDIDVMLQTVDLATQVAAVTDADLPPWLEGKAGDFDSLTARLTAIVTPGAAPPAPVAAKPAAKAKPAKSPATATDLSSFSMMDLFRSEAEMHLATLGKELAKLAGNAGNTTGIETLMRSAHSIKGAARVVGLDPIGRVAAALEDAFVAVQEKRRHFTADDVAALGVATELLGQMSRLDAASATSWFAKNEAAVENAIAQLEPGAAPAAATPAKPEAAPAKAAAAKSAAAPAEAPKAAEASDADKAKAADLRISAENLNRLMGLAGESVVAASWLEPYFDSMRELKKAQNDLGEDLEALAFFLEEQNNMGGALGDRVRYLMDRNGECRQILAHRMGDLDVFTRRSSNLSNRLYREVLACRMRPFGEGTKAFPRLIRDVARKLGKKVKLHVLGEETEVDRDILAKLDAPLNHILRNALDHGLEVPDERRAAGKEETGNIWLEARHHAGMLLVTVRDDGRGVHEAKLKAKIVERKLSTPEIVANMTPAELMDFMFLPGFSTATEVTEISGRGVGLDVVQSMIQEVGGVLRADSVPGKGVTFSMYLPVTRSVVRSLIVEVGGEPYAIPLSNIDHTLRVLRSEVVAVEEHEYFAFDGTNIGLVTAQQIFSLPATTFERDDLAVVVMGDRQALYGVVVDRFLGEREVVVHPLDERLGKIADIGAAALMQDGTPVLIVDVKDMIRSVENILSGGRLRKVDEGTTIEADAGRKRRILVVDDSITVREVEKKLLEGAGYDVELAVDGMDGWNAVRTGRYDLVISDVDMPRMTGIELVAKIKGDSRLQHLPVVIVSYKDRESDRLRGLEAGANAYLTKSSFHDDTLLKTIEELSGGVRRG